MYSEEAMRNDRGTASDFPTMERDKVTLQSAIQDTTMQAEKLGQMIAELLQRLEPLRQETPEKSMTSEVMARAVPSTQYGSPLAAQVDNIGQTLRAAQSRVARIMSDLDL